MAAVDVRADDGTEDGGGDGVGPCKDHAGAVYLWGLVIVHVNYCQQEERVPEDKE